MAVATASAVVESLEEAPIDIPPPVDLIVASFT
jgi:hypothetical protein